MARHLSPRARLILSTPCVVVALLLLQVQLPLQGQAPSPRTSGYERFNRSTEFDPHFSKNSKRYFGVGFDWRYFKAQAIAESGLREAARSPVGAVGIMQIMPATFEDIRRGNPLITGALTQARWNIAAGIWYNRQNFTIWKASRPFEDKLKFMFGSYNAGRGSVLRAQRLALSDGLDGTLWSSIEARLSAVTGRHSRETLGYVRRIFEVKPVLN